MERPCISCDGASMSTNSSRTNRDCRKRSKNTCREPRLALCEIATTMILSAGIGGEILQICETWLQCRQQVARDLSRGSFEICSFSKTNSATSAMKSTQHNSYSNSDRRTKDDG